MSATTDLIERVRDAGLELEAGPYGRLLVRPTTRLTPELRAELVARKAELLDALAGSRPPTPPDDLARVLALPLSQLDRTLRVRVPWLADPLWFVPTEADAEALVGRGEAARGAVWTVAELTDLLAIPGITRESARTVAEAKLEFGGDLVLVRGSESGKRT